MRATRNAMIKGLKGNLNRSEYIDFVTRVAITAYPKLSASEAVILLINQFLVPSYESKDVSKIRMMIRERAQLNELLFKNRAGL